MYMYQTWNNKQVAKQENSEILFSIQEVGSPINAFLVSTKQVVDSYNIPKLQQTFKSENFFETHDVSEILRGDYSRLAFDIDAKRITSEEFIHLVTQLEEMLNVLGINPKENLHGIMECVNTKLYSTNPIPEEFLANCKDQLTNFNPEKSNDSLEYELDMVDVLNAKFAKIHNVQRIYFTDKSKYLSIINFLKQEIKKITDDKRKKLHKIYEDFKAVNYDNVRNKTQELIDDHSLHNFTVFIFSFCSVLKPSDKWGFQKMLVVDSLDKYKKAKNFILENYNCINSEADKINKKYLSLAPENIEKLNREAESFAIKAAKALSLHLYVKGYYFNRTELKQAFSGSFFTSPADNNKYLDKTIDTSIYVNCGSQKCMRFGLSGKLSEARPAPIVSEEQFNDIMDNLGDYLYQPVPGDTLIPQVNLENFKIYMSFMKVNKFTKLQQSKSSKYRTQKESKESQKEVDPISLLTQKTENGKQQKTKGKLTCNSEEGKLNKSEEFDESEHMDDNIENLIVESYKKQLNKRITKKTEDGEEIKVKTSQNNHVEWVVNLVQQIRHYKYYNPTATYQQLLDEFNQDKYCYITQNSKTLLHQPTSVKWAINVSSEFPPLSFSQIAKELTSDNPEILAKYNKLLRQYMEDFSDFQLKETYNVTNTLRYTFSSFREILKRALTRPDFIYLLKKSFVFFSDFSDNQAANYIIYMNDNKEVVKIDFNDFTNQLKVNPITLRLITDTSYASSAVSEAKSIDLNMNYNIKRIPLLKAFNVFQNYKTIFKNFAIYRPINEDYESNAVEKTNDNSKSLQSTLSDNSNTNETEDDLALFEESEDNNDSNTLYNNYIADSKKIFSLYSNPTKPNKKISKDLPKEVSDIIDVLASEINNDDSLENTSTPLENKSEESYEIKFKVNPEKKNYILDWFAYILQHPESKNCVALAISSMPGTGKNVISNAVSRYLGQFATPNGSIDDLTGQYTAPIDNKLLFVINEVDVEKKNKDVLKPFMTESEVGVNVKYGPKYFAKNQCSFLFYSNHENIQLYGFDDRRFSHIVCKAPRLPDEFYSKILKPNRPSELKDEYYEQFINHLLSRDLSTYNPNSPKAFDKVEILESKLTARSPVLNIAAAILNYPNYKHPTEKEPIIGITEFIDDIDNVVTHNDEYSKFLNECKIVESDSVATDSKNINEKNKSINDKPKLIAPEKKSYFAGKYNITDKETVANLVIFEKETRSISIEKKIGTITRQSIKKIVDFDDDYEVKRQKWRKTGNFKNQYVLMKATNTRK